MSLITVSVDAMGGDYGPSVTIPAVLKALKQDENLQIILVGRPENLAIKHLAGTPRLIIRHASEIVAMDEQPQSALKNKKDSSMRVAINLVKTGESHACISAGNTGALMATARFVLKTLPGIDRPAIAGSVPSLKGTTYLLDIGANANCTSQHLFQFAVMGSMLAKCMTHKEHPTIGLLNIGSEDIKGNDTIKETVELLRASSLNFHGNVEGDDIFKGTTDVVVCDGFVGNVALKTAEGVSKMMSSAMRSAFERNIPSQFVGVLAKLVLREFRQRFDPRRHNGASFLGLRGIVVKSHGAADEYAFLHAIHTAVADVRNEILKKIDLEFRNNPLYEQGV